MRHAAGQLIATAAICRHRRNPLVFLVLIFTFLQDSNKWICRVAVVQSIERNLYAVICEEKAPVGSSTNLDWKIDA